MSDLRAALRLLTRRPGFCAGVVVTLGIGLASATAIFSVAYALLLRPLPFPDADRIVSIHAEVAGDDGRLALREFRDLERDARTLSRVGTYYRTQYNLTGGGAPEALTCTMPSSAMFDVLGVKARHGEIWPASMDFTRQYTVALSHGLWQQRFGSRADIIGQTIILDGAPYRVAAVLPDNVDFPLKTDVYRAVTDYNAPHVRRYSVVARMADGRTLADVQGELDSLAARFASAWPETNRGVRLRAVPLRDAYVGGARPFILLMAGGVALLVLIACVNVTNLLLSRALAQQGDAAVRLALGASRRHVVQQSMAEALLLALIGAAVGALGARAAVRFLASLIGSDLPPWMSIDVDAPVLIASALVAVIVAALVGLLPALQAARTNVERVLRQESGRSAGGSHRSVRRWLVGAQAALASLLLVAAGVFAAGLTELLRVNPGFDARGVFTFRVDPPFSRYPDIPTTAEFYRRASEALREIPGITAVGTTTNLPFGGLDISSPRIIVDGQDSGRADESPFANLQLVDTDYFSAMGIALVRGRVFERTDVREAPAVVVVSERAAQHFWGAADPIGRRLRITWNQNGVGGGGGSDITLTVIGVVRSVRFDGVQDEDGLDVYAPHTQMFAGDSYFVLRSTVAPDRLEAVVRRAIDTVDPEQSFFDRSTMEARIERTVWQHRVSTAVLAMFAAVALTLAVIGTYAVTAHAVAAQRREIGIRLALGSPAGALRWLVARSWIVPVCIGMTVGLLLGAAVSRALADVLGVAVPALGWPSALPAFLAVAAAIACAIPIQRTLRHYALAEALRAD
jgi:putative ABC transport system permease protein